MSIYVSIACLGADQELITTIGSCFDNATNPDDVYIGLALIGEPNFKEYILEKIEEFGFKNIKHKYFISKKHLGVGAGRTLAATMYDNEDYFLQIDAHTFLDKGWDSYLVDKFEKAKIHVNNEKVVLSGYPGKYGYLDEDNNISFWTKPILQYPYWMPDSFIIDGETIPSWSDAAPWDLNNELWEMVEQTGFAPIGKISAAFLFSDANLVKDKLCIDKESMFWEEEIIQTINLIDNGYTLVYPGNECKIFHYYIGENNQEGVLVGRRQGISDFMPGPDYKKFVSDMQKRFIKFVKNKDNHNKIKVFEEYNNINLLSGAKDSSYFPKYYINSVDVPTEYVD